MGMLSLNSKPLIVVFLLLLPLSAQASEIFPTSSAKANEVEISRLLNDRLNVNSSLKVIDEQGDDLRVTTLFAKDAKRGLPKIVVFVDTKVANKEKSGKAKSQVISIFSTAEIKVDNSNRLGLLEWANSWNSNVLPIRVQIVEGKVIAAINLVATNANPISEGVILSSYLSVLQAWPAIIQSLGKNNLLLK